MGFTWRWVVGGGGFVPRGHLKLSRVLGSSLLEL